MIKRKLLSVIIFFLATVPGMSVLQAANISFNVLDRLDVKVSKVSSELTIRFAVPVNYSGHSPQKEGKTIIIRVKPLVSNAPDVRSGQKNILNSTSFKSNERLSWMPTAAMPLQEVRYLGGEDGGSVIEINFTKKVAFTIVKSQDFRALTLIVQRPKEVEAKSDSKGVSGRKSRYNYTVNLVTSSKPFDLARIKSKEYPAGLTFYTIKTNVEGKTLHHLRVGFFHSASDIREALKAVRPYYKSARVMLASRNDVASAKNANPKLRVAASPANQPKIRKNESAASLMKRAKRSLIRKQYQNAIVLYTSVIRKYPSSKQAKGAREFLGVAHQRSRQYVHAKNVYKAYLKKYPKGADAIRVKQRLVALKTASSKAKAKLKNNKDSKIAKKAPKWRVYGNVFSTLRRDEHETSNSPIKTSTTTFATSLNATATRRGKKDTIKMRFSGSYVENDSSVGSSGSDYQISYLYFDYNNNVSDYGFRLGRQAKYAGGVQGRFDGASFDYRLSEKWKLNLVAGFPVNLSSNKNISSDKSFVGVNVDLRTSSKYLTYNLFTIFQTVDGISDRESVGGEIRYLHPNRSIFIVTDYDTSYNALNKFLFVNNWRLKNKATLNLVYDYRRSPLLTTSNALQGQSATSIKELLTTMTEGQIRQLAEDRTATFKSLTLSGSYPMGQDWTLNGDFVVSKLDSTVASGGVAATLGTDNEFFYTVQAIRSNWFKSGDSTIFSIRLANTTNYDKWTYSVVTRYPLGRKWRIVPRMAIDLQDLSDGSDITTLRSSLRLEYRAGRNYRFELEGGYATAEYKNSTNDREDTDIYYNLNFIADF